MPRAALFRAGKALQARCRRGVLTDFCIGADAELTRLRPLTRDATCYRTYLPTLAFVASVRPLPPGAVPG